MAEIKKVTVGYGEGSKDITNLVKGNTLRIALSDGKIIEVEAFERRPGRLTIRSGAISGGLIVYPLASNCIDVEVEK